MDNTAPYSTPAGVEAAIKDAAKRAVAGDPSLSLSERIRLAHFDRFLCRVFADGDSSEWLLKGGTGILARVRSSRPTLDIDLHRQGYALDEAHADLQRLAAVDLGDHFFFDHVGAKEIATGEAQPYAEGYRVSFNVRIGQKHLGGLGIDLVTGTDATAEITTAVPVNRLNLPRLVSKPYRLYPVVDQIADKVCATMAEYRAQESSREKDLVDLVVFAATQSIEGSSLRVALATEALRRRMDPIERFIVPSSWGAGYAKLSKLVPHCAGYRTVDLAGELITRLIDPALSDNVDGRMWDCEARAWVRISR